MIVLARPHPDYRSLLGRKCITQEWSNILYFQRARDALQAGLERLGLHRGDTIVIPAYICDSTLAPLRTAGYRILFVDIREDFQFDLAQLSAVIRKSGAKAILVVHYFGLPSDMERLLTVCRPLGVKVIEDCCHSFLTHINGVRVGYCGDAAIFSMRKTLGIPDGGALRLNGPHCAQVTSLTKPLVAPSVAPYLTGRVIEALIAMLGWPNFYSRAVDGVKDYLRGRIADSANSSPDVSGVQQLPSRLLSGNLASKNNLRRISNRVRANYRYIMKGVCALGLHPYARELPTGCVPQWFLLDDSSERIVPWLREHGVGACRWPWNELPAEVAASPSMYPNCHELNRRLALLPIHQSIGPRQMKCILRHLGECVRRPIVS